MDQQNLLFLVIGLVVALFVLRPLLFGGRRVNPEEAAQRISAGTAVLIDVREPSEWADGVAQPAVLLTLGDLRGERKNWKPFLEKNRGKELILYCASGVRSGMAASQLKSEGFSVANLGGFGRWVSASLPVRKP
jgi:rhodanese-related sulfurtransferase